MLRKIISIKNVGRFLNYSAVGDVELKRYNLAFAENGRGKTTLCAILRSLQSGDASHVIGRNTLGLGGSPEIKILLQSGTATFSVGAWNTTVPNLAIFDSTFVSENVYSGDAVDLTHKRNLYRVIVGRRGVVLARQIDELDAESRAKSTEIREKRATVQALVPQGLTVEDFLLLEEDAGIDTKIADKAREFEAVKQADQIRTRGGLEELVLPTFPEGFAGLLGKTIDGIAKDAERQITKQIQAHAMHKRGQTWLSEGIGYISHNACPFCGQSLEGVALIAAYKAYFSEAYNGLRTEISSLRQMIETAFGDREIARVERILDQNTNAAEFWMRYCTFTPPVLAGSDKVGDTLRTLRQTAMALLDRKAAAPLDQVQTDASFAGAFTAFTVAQSDVAAYNQAVQAANGTISAKKAETSVANVRTVEAALTSLRATKKRHEPDAQAACDDYKAALEAKNAVEDKKAEIKKELDAYAQTVFDQYERTINQLLDDFQAGFRITETKHGYPGGVASSSYQISINETPVDLGDSGTPLDRPSFKNTLSSGDKSTLALAFFLAQLEHDPEKVSKIVVFDDPFNSQDSFRKDHTIQKIKKCGESCLQIIVLSHEQNFLKRIWDRFASQGADRKCLRFARVGTHNTTISEWDIEQATQAQFLADLKALADYYNKGEGTPRDIVNKIRPVLETYLKNLYPGEYATNTLGTIIGKVRTAGATHTLFPLLDGLDALNEYTRRYHHGENPNAGTEPINDSELQGFVKKTLEITGGC